MEYLVAALPNDMDLAGFLGKKGSSNGITFFNKKSEDIKLVVLTPTNLEEKFYGLAESILLGEVVILSTKSPDKVFAESIVAASLLKKPVMLTNDNDVSQMLSGFELNVLGKIDKGNALDSLKKFKQESQAKEEQVAICVDKAFPVKGVGTVLLGVVQKGKVKVHDTLYLPNGKEVPVRSIQVQDDDVQEAGKGARVGLAVKSISHEDVQKGDMLAPKRITYAAKITAKVEFSKLAKTDVIETPCAISSGFTYANCKSVKKIDAETFEFEVDKQISLDIDENILVIREDSPRIFAVGKVVGKA